jgi:DNA primase
MTWLDETVERAHAALMACGPAHPARQYLAARGVIGDTEIARYRLGYWAEPPAVSTCTPEFWDWSRRYGWSRLVFPLTDGLGGVIGMQVRHLGDKGYENFVLKPRDLYVPLFGLHVALPEMYARERCVLVEGVFDYFAVLPYAPDVLCTLTSNVTLSVRRLLARYVSLVVCLYDMDLPGRRGAYKMAGLPIPEAYRKPEDVTVRPKALPPYTVLLPNYTEHDPDDLRKAGKGAELQRLVQPQVAHLDTESVAR